MQNAVCIVVILFFPIHVHEVLMLESWHEWSVPRP